MNWYVVQCKPGQQARAEINLRNQGFSIYSPCMKFERIVRRQRVMRSEAVFPGYIFIQLDAHANWSVLRSTRGVCRLVSFNGSPQAVPDALLVALHARFDEQPAQALFQPGDKVRVTEGCFNGVEAVVQAVTADERIIVLMKLLQSEHALAMDIRQLAKAG
jgi:transcriptional antiterminator RfaH